MSVALTFVSPPPGLAPLVDFHLTKIEDAAGLYALQAADTGKRLYVLDPGVYLEDYTPVISDEQCSALDVTAPEDVWVLVVANPGENGTTMNLMAPIVVNTASGKCAQIILDNQDWPLQAELSARSA